MTTTPATTLSFEFFPPKTKEGLVALKQTALKLTAAEPAFFSVTFGAGGSTRTGTLETVKELQALGATVAPHLAAVGLTRSEITSILQSYKDLNIKRIVVIRGDLPSGMGQVGELRFAHELVHLIRELTGEQFYIEVAAYPEVHPQAVNAFKDIENLKRKVGAGANSAITQYFYHADSYFFLRDLCHAEGITIPLVPGIMPITNYSKLARFSDICGAEIPRWIRRRLEAYGDDISSIQEFGAEVVLKLCEQLAVGGVPGLHFYTLNHADPSLQLLKKLKF
jgi:methylenetetrahydrofolate reductase (NADPH)